MKILVIDSGTTTSRVRLTDGRDVLGSARRQVGARDVARTGSTEILKQALKTCIEDVLAACRMELSDIEGIVASGMITSNMGLKEIPHLPAPVGLDQLAAHLEQEVFPEIADKPILFIPGVKTGFDGEQSIEAKDMMRGEEAEIFGYLESLGEAANEPVLFMHYGSHHKGIRLDNGQITECRTSVTGELMMAVEENTILRSSLIPVQELNPDMEWVRKGLSVAESCGFGRALFSTRVCDTMEKRSKRESTSFFVGVLLSLDFAMLSDLLNRKTRRVVLYGKELYPSVFAPLLRERYPDLVVDVISEQESDTLSVKGAAIIYQRFIRK